MLPKQNNFNQTKSTQIHTTNVPVSQGSNPNYNKNNDTIKEKQTNERTTQTGIAHNVLTPTISRKERTPSAIGMVIYRMKDIERTSIIELWFSALALCHPF